MHDSPMRAAALFSLLIVCACGGSRTDVEADTAAVYEAFLEGSRPDHPRRVLLQDVTAPVSVELLMGWRNGSPRDEVSHDFSPEVREALEDLVRRSASPRPLAPGVRVGEVESRISADSARALFEVFRTRRLRQLADSASVVQLSAVGFSRDGAVAAVYENVVCGYLCGGAQVYVVRKHPGGWLLAEEVVFILY